MEPNLPTPTKAVSKPKKPCACRKCENKTTETYCEDHEHLASRYNWNNRSTHPWYQKKVWRGNPNKEFGKRGGLRERQLMQEPLCECEQCQQRSMPKPASVVDHIKEWKEGETEAEQWVLFVDPDNLQSMAESCHNRKTARNNK